MNKATKALIGRSPGQSIGDRIELAALLALRTLLQSLAAAFPAAGAGTFVLDTSYWRTLGYSCLAALVSAAVSFLQNISSLLPETAMSATGPVFSGNQQTAQPQLAPELEVATAGAPSATG
jgi:hypothetical protein